MSAEEHPLVLPKKLIEVMLPLDAINREAAREKSIRQGHPSTLHLWWARRPLASARAVIFAQTVNDPGDPHIYGKNGENEKVRQERERLFNIIEKLVKWENVNNETVIAEAHGEIVNSWRKVCALNSKHPQADELFNPDKLPALHDPFAGGGAIPLEANRLGFDSYASDLNPVAVLLNKAMLEIPARFAKQLPVGPVRQEGKAGKIAGFQQGLVEDVQRYGYWVYDEAVKAIGHLYPSIAVDTKTAADHPKLTKDKEGLELPVLAWLWARTVASPDPRYKDKHSPLVSNFVLQKNKAYVQPEVKNGDYFFNICYSSSTEHAKQGTKLGGGGLRFRCLFSGETITGNYIKAEGKAGRIGHRLMAVVADGGKKLSRVYLPATSEQEQIALEASPTWKPTGLSPTKLTGGTCSIYGLTTWGDFFTNRQLVGLNTLSDFIAKAIKKCEQDAMNAGLSNDGIKLENGGIGATAYSEAIGVFLSLALSRITDTNNSLCGWNINRTMVRGMYARQSIAMTWDYGENHLLSKWNTGIGNIGKIIINLPTKKIGLGVQEDAQCLNDCLKIPQNNKIITTDPPYYDNIAYADISDFFYMWLRKNLRTIYPSLFATIQTPKKEELVALAYRHESKTRANDFFMNGMTQVMATLRQQTHPAFPVAIYYAFKQSETKDGKTYSTGWASFLEALLSAGYTITGTWPMRTEFANRQLSIDANALSSSIILVCRKKQEDNTIVTREEFIRQLNKELPVALEKIRLGELYGDIAPVDMSQAVIGPGMEIFSRYDAVLHANGSKMEVKESLELINQYIGNERYDATTMFCLRWFQEYRYSAGQFGNAHTLARAINADIGRMSDIGILSATAGKVQLLPAQQYRSFDETQKHEISQWQALHFVAHALSIDGFGAAGKMLGAMVVDQAEVVNLARRLFIICERKQWSEEGRFYNSTVNNWKQIQEAGQKQSRDLI